MISSHDEKSYVTHVKRFFFFLFYAAVSIRKITQALTAQFIPEENIAIFC